MQARDPQPGTLVDGRYRLVQIIGQGGMGMVYAADDQGRECALKILRAEIINKPNLMRRFTREARAIQSFSHEHVVEVLAVGTDPESRRPYIAMEMLNGFDFRYLIRACGPLPPEPVVTLFIQACYALGAAHRQGIIHRDIKPSNLFLHHVEPGRIMLKLCDFGLAKITDVVEGGPTLSTDLTQTDGLLGSPMYMSPEQALNPKNVDRRTDIWGLGASLYEALSGKKMWDGSLSMGELIVTICTKSPTPIEQVAPWLDSGLMQVIRRALARDPDERYSSIEELAQALAPFGAKSGEVSQGDLPDPDDEDQTTTKLQEITPRRRTSTPRPSSQPALLGRPGSAPIQAMNRMAQPQAGSQSTNRLPTGTQAPIGQAAQSHASSASQYSSTQMGPVWWQQRSTILGAIGGAVAIVGLFLYGRYLADPVSQDSAQVAKQSAEQHAKAASAEVPADAAPIAKAEPDAATGDIAINPDRLSSFNPLPLAPTLKPGSRDEALAELGQMLFHDKRLSKDERLACRSCHDLDEYGINLAEIKGTAAPGQRNTPTVLNSADHFSLYWDGRAKDADTQVRLAIAEKLGASPRHVKKTLSDIPGYVKAFEKAFPKDKTPIELDNVVRAIVAYERMLVTPSPWDRFLRGDAAALTDKQKRGFNLFIDVGCISCHFGPYVGATMYQKVGLVVAWPSSQDPGRIAVTGQEADRMVFKVPSLRNVAETAPYFHDGSAATLSEAVKLMAKHQLGKTLSDSDISAIVAWMSSLTGELPAELIKEPALPPGDS